MIDDQTKLKTFLQANTALVNLVATDIHPRRREAPTKWVPSGNGCLVFDRRSAVTDESGQVLEASYQFKCYGKGKLDSDQRTSADAIPQQSRAATGVRLQRLDKGDRLSEVVLVPPEAEESESDEIVEGKQDSVAPDGEAEAQP